jgi:hypothetical protein
VAACIILPSSIEYEFDIRRGITLRTGFITASA